MNSNPERTPAASEEGVSRRTVLIAIAGGAALAAGAGGFYLIRDTGSGSDGDGSTTTIDAGSGVARVGTAYLDAYPDEADPDTLASTLGISATNADAVQYLATSSDEIQQDFDDGQVVNLDGWRLSVREARASALVTLTQ